MASADEGIDDITMDPYSRQASVMTQSNRRDKLKGLGRSMKRSVADFFGVGEECPEEQEKWRQRSINLACKASVGGRVKPGLMRSGTMDSVFVDTGSHMGAAYSHPGGAMSAGVHLGTHHPLSASFPARPTPMPYDPLAIPRRQGSYVSRGLPMRQISRQISTASSCRRSTRMHPTRKSRKDSVAKMAYDGMKTLVEDDKPEEPSAQRSSGLWRSPSKKSTKHRPYLHSRSFAPTSISSYMEDMDTLKKPKNNEMLKIMEECEPQKDQSPADSVFGSEEGILDDVFFNTPAPTSPLVQPFSGPPPFLNMGGARADTDGLAGASSLALPAATPALPSSTPALPTLWEASRRADQDEDDEHRGENGTSEETKPLRSKRRKLVRQAALRHDSDDGAEPAGGPPGRWPVKSGWQLGRQKPTPAPGTPGVDADVDEVDGPFSPMQRLPEKVISDFADNSDRREIGKGVVGRLFKTSYRRERINSDIKAQLDDINDHRPYFTYWVTFVQVLIYIISVAVYGIAPIGFEDTLITGEVMMPSLAIEKKHFFEQDNFWIGPRQADLIHLGAKYSPCMRKDENVERAIKMDREDESKTACCIRNDGSGCVQTEEPECSKTLSTWFKWTEENPGPKGRKSGSVCGVDPRNCLSPGSSGGFEWDDNITQWPLCTETTNVTRVQEHQHLTCEVVGRPCCIGIQGDCMITTREYCAFRRGYFHEEASICAQVSCMNEICGMIPFLNDDRPDQFYRLWTGLFLHAGLLQLGVTVLFQFFIMRDLEKLAGWLRITIIYLGSGIAGSLSSAIFLPYHVEAGPAGSQFGLLACLFVEIIQNWYILQHPFWSIGKLTIILVVLFLVGLLPMVDNYAHLVGFLFGFLLSFALMPYVTFGKFDRTRKIVGIVLCLLTSVGLLSLLVVLFYVIGVYSCPNCEYFNCIPFTKKFCDSMAVKIRRS